jgi:hypothetical protein
MLAGRRYSGECCYLEVLVLAVSFPYILAVFLVPYPYWVGTFLRYPSRVG